MRLKHVFLVTAYQDAPSLNRLMHKLLEYGQVLIHIDKNSALQLNDIEAREGVEVYKKYKVNWGSYHHLKSILFLLKEAMRHHPDYVHVITGQDYPIVSSEDFDAFFVEHEGQSFLDFESVPDGSWMQERYKYYWFTDCIQHPKSFDFLPHPMIGKLLKWQKRLGIKRCHIGDFGIDEMRKGMVYVSLHKDAARYVLDYLSKHSVYVRSLRTCLIPEEFCFQTILVNSPLRDTLVNDNLRYMDWQFRDGISPCVLNETDYDAIKSSGKLIMRKVSAQSNQLIELLHGKEI